MNDVTITFPAIPAETLAQLDQTETFLAQTEQDFVHTLREKYTPLARFNGFIKVSDFTHGAMDVETVMERDGKRLRALLVSDNFNRLDTGNRCGRYSGSRLYLTEQGEWIETVRAGHWTRNDGAVDYWTADGAFAPGVDEDLADECDGAEIRVLSDWQVADEYNMSDIAVQFAQTLKIMAEKLPERLTRKRALAESLATATAALRA